MLATDLEAAIDDSPDDPAPYLVYGDWLQATGDPRGELVMLHHRDRRREADAWIATHAAHFLGPFTDFVDDRQSGHDRRRLDLVWELGFVRAVHIGWERYGTSQDAALAQFRELLALPSCRFLQHLKLGPVPVTRGPASSEMSFVPFLDALIERRPATLRTVFAGDTGGWRISTTRTGAAARLLGAFPRLRHLVLRGAAVHAGAIAHRELRAFGLQTGALASTTLAELAAARWPALERLELWFGDRHHGATATLAGLGPILDARGLPRLEHLGLRNCAFADDLAAALPGSRVLRQLWSLDLSLGALSDAGVRAMHASRREFSHLEHLDLSENALTDAARPLARELAAHVTFGDTHDPARAAPDVAYRHVAVGD